MSQLWAIGLLQKNKMPAVWSREVSAKNWYTTYIILRRSTEIFVKTRGAFFYVDLDWEE